MRRNFSRLLAHFALVICLGLCSCDQSSPISENVLTGAILTQKQLTHFELANVLELDQSNTFEVVSVKVKDSEVISSGEQTIISVSGDFFYKFPGIRTPKMKSNFGIFLQKGSKGQSWRLARRITSSNGGLNDWETFPLPIID